MNKIYTAINEKSNGKYKDLRFPKVTFGSNATVTVVCKKDDSAMLRTNTQELLSLLGEVCGFHTPVKIEISDEPPTASVLRSAVVKFTEKFSYVSSIIHTITAQTEGEYSIKMKMHDTMYDFAKDDYLPRLDEFLKNSFVESVKIDVERVEFSKSGALYSATGRR